MPRDLLSDQLESMPIKNQMMNSTQNSGMTSTFLGKLPSDLGKQLADPENVKSFLQTALPMAMGGGAGALAIKGAEEVAPFIKKGIDYLNPAKSADEFLQKIGGGKTAQENIEELAKRIHFARTSAAEEALAHKRPVYEQLGDKPIGDSQYLKEGTVSKWFSPRSPLGKKESSFQENPTLNNSDELQKSLGERIGRFMQKSLREPLLSHEAEELEDLKTSRDLLNSDQDRFIESQSPYLANQNRLFRNKWRENVSVYDEDPILVSMARKGETKGISPADIKKIFKYQTAKSEKISSDISPSGQQNVIYNELQSSGSRSPNELAEAINKAKQFGYQNYITPDMENLASQLIKRQKHRDYLNSAGGAIGGFALGGIPGAAIGGALFNQPARALAKSLFERGIKRF